MKHGSLFSGIGGFELGIQRAYEEIYNLRSTKRLVPKGTESNNSFENKSYEWECVGYSETDKHACQIYEKHFNHKNYGDITRINVSELPDFDLLVGGVPCQSWSIAGNRGGFDDARGNMWFECFKILRAKRPKFFLFENVKGLLSHNGGKSMERICEELCESGYAIDFEVLNSKNFGVPQNRERVFIVGIRLDLLDDCQIF